MPSTNDVDARIASLAARQRGVVSRAQALELGATDSMIHRRLRSGRWERRFPGVYLVVGCPPDWMQEVWCAVLAAGSLAVVTHESALRLHGVELLPIRPISLTVPHGGHARLSGVFAHQIDDLRPHRVVSITGLPVSAPARTAVELAATRWARELGRAIDALVDAKRVSFAAIGACLREVARPGKPGVEKLGKLLDERQGGYVPPQSELERALFAALAAAGLPEPRRQFPLPGRGAVEGRVDAAYPEAKLILEADGLQWHRRVAVLKQDHQRDTEAARAGWLTLRFTYEEIATTPTRSAPPYLTSSPSVGIASGQGEGWRVRGAWRRPAMTRDMERVGGPAGSKRSTRAARVASMARSSTRASSAPRQKWAP